MVFYCFLIPRIKCVDYLPELGGTPLEVHLDIKTSVTHELGDTISKYKIVKLLNMAFKKKRRPLLNDAR